MGFPSENVALLMDVLQGILFQISCGRAGTKRPVAGLSIQ